MALTNIFNTIRRLVQIDNLQETIYRESIGLVTDDVM